MIEFLEKAFFYLFLAFFPFNIKKFLFGFLSQESPLTEFNSAFLYLSDFLILGLLVCWALRSLKEKKALFQSSPLGLLLGVIILVGLLSLFGAQDIRLGLYMMARSLEGFLFFFYLRSNFQRYSLSRVVALIVAGGALQGIIALAQYLKQESLGLKYLGESFLSPQVAGVAKIWTESGKVIRSYGTFPHPNILAAFLLVGLLGSLYFILKKPTEGKKIFFWTSLFFILLGIVLTFSRAAAFFGALATVFFLGGLYLRSTAQGISRLHIRQAFVFLALGGVLLVAVFWPALSFRFPSAGEQAIALRSFYNHQALRYAKNFPLLGVGWGNFLFSFPKAPGWEEWMAQPVHNIYLLILAELGFLGLVLFLVFLCLILKQILSFSALQAEQFLFLVLAVTFLAMACFDHFFWTIQQGRLLFWLILGIAANLASQGHNFNL